ncbi:hypothetical protein GGG16DRAFT_118590 [Schizophyllum commune]
MANRNLSDGKDDARISAEASVQFQDIADRLLNDRTAAELTRLVLAVGRFLGFLAGTHAPVVVAERVGKGACPPVEAGKTRERRPRVAAVSLWALMDSSNAVANALGLKTSTRRRREPLGCRYRRCDSSLVARARQKSWANFGRALDDMRVGSPPAAREYGSRGEAVAVVEAETEESADASAMNAAVTSARCWCLIPYACIYGTIIRFFRFGLPEARRRAAQIRISSPLTPHRFMVADLDVQARAQAGIEAIVGQDEIPCD